MGERRGVERGQYVPPVSGGESGRVRPHNSRGTEDVGHNPRTDRSAWRWVMTRRRALSCTVSSAELVSRYRGPRVAATRQGSGL
jgi:hypothetical protein